MNSRISFVDSFFLAVSIMTKADMTMVCVRNLRKVSISVQNFANFQIEKQSLFPLAVSLAPLSHSQRIDAD